MRESKKCCLQNDWFFRLSDQLITGETLAHFSLEYFVMSEGAATLPVPPTPTSPAISNSHVLEDEEDVQEAPPPTMRSVFLRFFLSRHPVAVALKLVLVAAILLPLGIGVSRQFPDSVVMEMPMGELLIYFGIFFLGTSIFMCLLNFVLRLVLSTADESGRVGTTALFISELQIYFASSFFIILFLILINTSNFLTASVLRNELARIYATKFLVCATISIAVMGWKRYFMKREAMRFNFSNFSDRILESLAGERIIQNLSKSKAAFKFRSRFTKTSLFPFMQRPTHSTIHGSGESGTAKRRMSDSEDPHIEKSATLSARKSLEEGDMPMESLTVRSADFVHVEDAPSSSVPPRPSSLKVSPASSTGSMPKPPQPAKQPAEAEKKRQFASFTLLASKTLAMFDASTGDYKAETAREARKIASKLFRWLKPPNREYLIPSDLAPYLEDPEDMKRALAMFRGRKLTGLPEIITENDMRRGLDQLLQDRCGLAKSMQSIETALDKINILLTVFFSFFLVICFVMIFAEVGKLLQALASLFGAAAFIFSTTATHLFESVIFLLVIHPFDVGDRVYIPLSTTGPLSPTGETNMDNLVVVEMHVLSTIFERWDGIRIYVQNHILATKPIFNIRRSGPIRDYMRLQVAFDTPLEKLNQLRKRIEMFVSREASDFGEYCLLNVEYLENCNKLGLQVIVLHRTNWQDMELQLGRRNKILMFLRGALDELSITYSLPVQRVQILGDTNNFENRSRQSQLNGNGGSSGDLGTVNLAASPTYTPSN